MNNINIGISRLGQWRLNTAVSDADQISTYVSAYVDDVVPKQFEDAFKANSDYALVTSTDSLSIDLSSGMIATVNLSDFITDPSVTATISANLDFGNASDRAADAYLHVNALNVKGVMALDLPAKYHYVGDDEYQTLNPDVRTIFGFTKISQNDVVVNKKEYLI